MGKIPFPHELLALSDTEFVLLVDDDQTEVWNCEALGEQGVSADEQAGAGRGSGETASRRFGCLSAARLHFHIHTKWFEPTGEIPEVLFSQDFRWRHECDVEATLQGHQGGASSDCGFAGADVTL
jgi:hypothetical protein